MQKIFKELSQIISESEVRIPNLKFSSLNFLPSKAPALQHLSAFSIDIPVVRADWVPLNDILQYITAPPFVFLFG